MPGMLNEKIMKADYDIIFKNSIRLSDSPTMCITSFFSALEQLADKSYSENAHSNLKKLIDGIYENI
jgi:hypothetical protein